MATVTGYTAQRMKQIEDKAIVDGEVRGDNLWLIPYDQINEIDAGNVRGPQGIKGDTGEISQAELDAVTGVSTGSGNDLLLGPDGKPFFDHDTKYRDHCPHFADVAQRDAAIPSPTLGQICTVGLKFQQWTDSLGWRPPWSTAWGVVAHVKSTGVTLGISTALVNLLTLPNVTFLAGRRYLLSAVLPTIVSNAPTAAGTINWGMNMILPSVAGTYFEASFNVYIWANNVATEGGTLFGYYEPAATVTSAVQMGCSVSNGTIGCLINAHHYSASVQTLTVEDIGPANP